MTDTDTTKAAGEAAAQNSDETQASNGSSGRSAEVRELERQLEEARQKLKEAEQRAQENLDRWQRAQADLANFRRRAQFDREELSKYATAALVESLLPVLDNFSRAWQTLPGNLRRLTWLSGVDMINQQLRYTLERLGLQEIDADGQPFDPSLHEAVDREEGDGTPHVVAVYQAGYKLHERVLRPTLVKVGPKPGAGSASQQSGEGTEQQAQPDGDQPSGTPESAAAKPSPSPSAQSEAQPVDG
jgi:molecular chaperone GrpE